MKPRREVHTWGRLVARDPCFEYRSRYLTFKPSCPKQKREFYLKNIVAAMAEIAPLITVSDLTLRA